MKKFSPLKKIHMAGFVFTCIAGTLLHFLYNWTGQNKFIAAFSATNESTWEHLKLLWVPIVLFAIIEYFVYGKKQKNFLCVKYLAAVVGMSFITIAVYTYAGILGRNVDFINISLYFIGAAVAWRFSYKYVRTDRFSSPVCVPLCRVSAALTAVCFLVWTYSPPQIGIFISPV
ncbi:MAG: hypothetical protein E7523_05910 [Ruminococcaceae bacterium]|nr:hypothetical protein [Oscillospiraceae bacterium]